jgi:hypothetical protein
MPKAVYRMMSLLCALVVNLPIGTNLGLLQLLWMLVSGRLLAARGAVIPGLDACGLARRAVRRAWARQRCRPRDVGRCRPMGSTPAGSSSSRVMGAVQVPREAPMRSTVHQVPRLP